MASLFGPSASAVDPNKTFEDKLKKTNYGAFIEETLYLNRLLSPQDCPEGETVQIGLCDAGAK